MMEFSLDNKLKLFSTRIISVMTTIVSNKTYKPESFNRLFWLIAKRQEKFNNDLDIVDNVRIAMSDISGTKPEDIPSDQMVDMAINALTEYYTEVGMNPNSLHELFRSFTTHQAIIHNDQWSWRDGSNKIVTACIVQFGIAPVRANDGTLIVDLGLEENLANPSMS